MAAHAIPLAYAGSPQLALLHAKIEVEMVGMVARTATRYDYLNKLESLHEVALTLTTTRNSAITNMSYILDGNVTDAKLATLTEARERYDDNIAGGYGTMLAESSDHGTYTISLGNVRPKQTLSVRVVSTCMAEIVNRAIQLDFDFPQISNNAPPFLTLDTIYHSTTAVRNVDVIGLEPDAKMEKTMGGTLTLLLGGPCRVIEPRVSVIWGFDVGEIVCSVACAVQETNETAMAITFQAESADPALSTPDYHILLDASGSMRDVWDRATRAVRIVVCGLPPCNFSVCTFRQTPDFAFPVAREVYSDASRKAALEFIDQCRPGGSTSVLAPLVHCCDQNDRPAIVILITDGAFDDTSAVTRYIKDHHSSKQFKVVALGIGDDADKLTLREVTALSGGVARFITPDDSIETAVAKLFAEGNNLIECAYNVTWPFMEPAPPVPVTHFGQTITLCHIGTLRTTVPPTVTFTSNRESALLRTRVVNLQLQKVPSPGNSIHAAISKRIHQSVPTVGSAEKELKYGYLGPNTAFVACDPTGGQAIQESSTFTKLDVVLVHTRQDKKADAMLAEFLRARAAAERIGSATQSLSARDFKGASSSRSSQPAYQMECSGGVRNDYAKPVPAGSRGGGGGSGSSIREVFLFIALLPFVPLVFLGLWIKDKYDERKYKAARLPQPVPAIPIHREPTPPSPAPMVAPRKFDWEHHDMSIAIQNRAFDELLVHQTAAGNFETTTPIERIVNNLLNGKGTFNKAAFDAAIKKTATKKDGPEVVYTITVVVLLDKLRVQAESCGRIIGKTLGWFPSHSTESMPMLIKSAEILLEPIQISP